MPSDPFGRAIRDHYRGERTEPLIDRDGGEMRDHRIEEWYFGTNEGDEWYDPWLAGPLLDIGAGAGRDTLYYQDRFETVAIEVSEHLVRTMRDRGVADARVADMFGLREHFPRDRFRSVLVWGTQVQLAGSMAGVRTFLCDLAAVTTADATAILHGYAPELDATDSIFAYRDDPAPGLAYRVYHSVYEGVVGETLLFRLFSLDRLRETTIGTPWRVVDTRYGHDGDETEPTTWVAALQKG